MKRACVFLLLLVVTEQARSDASYARTQETLRRTLMENYDKYALPNKKTIVTFTGIDVRDFTMNQQEHAMKMHAWLKYNWVDPRFQWEPSDYGNIQSLGMNADAVWKPDLSFYTSATAEDTTKKADVQVIAYSTGKVLHVPPYDLGIRCIMDLTYWPHDSHNCTITVGSWIHNGLVLELFLEDYKVETWMSQHTNETRKNLSQTEFDIKDWHVQNNADYYSCCEEPYYSIKTSFLFKRNASAYNWTVKLPVVCLCLLTLVLFLLPPGAGEKVIFGGVCLILDFFYLNYITQQVSYAPTHTPLIVQLLGQQIVMVMVSVFVSASVVRMARGPHSYGLPPFIKGSVGSLAKFLCLGSYVDSESSSSGSAKSEDSELGSGKADPSPNVKHPNVCEWLMLSAIVDRIILILYFAICTISLIRFSSVL